MQKAKTSSGFRSLVVLLMLALKYIEIYTAAKPESVACWDGNVFLADIIAYWSLPMQMSCVM